MEYNLVEMWLRKDPTRWIAGALSGLLAGIVALGVGMLISQAYSFEVWFPVKLMGTIILGPSSTEIGASIGIIAGGAFFEALCMFLGVVFSHFIGSNSFSALLPMGLVWGVFSWIFIWNLFMQSFTSIYAARISSGLAFVVCIAFGLALTSVSIFDSMLRKK